MKYLIIIILVLFSLIIADTLTHGDGSNEYPSYPNWQERSVLVLTNACRFDPIAYRDLMIGDYNILLSNNYPAVGPVYWDLNLNIVARNHAKDMANNCGMQHNSCDSTSWYDRVKSIYTESGWLSENIACGYESPQRVVYGWLMDGDPPAQDLTSAAGHRTNIMKDIYTEIGCGYANNELDYFEHYWVQDFAGKVTSEFLYHPIVSGTHLFLNSGKTSFWMCFYDSVNNNPSEVKLILENKTYNLSLKMGQLNSGIYNIDLSTINNCRTYYFEVKDGAGNNWRYPEMGSFKTFGEGSCAENYVAAGSSSIKYELTDIKNKKDAFIIKAFSSNLNIIITRSQNQNKLISSSIYNVAGKFISKQYWNYNSKQYKMTLTKQLPCGVYYMKHLLSNGKIVNSKLLILK